MATFDLKDSVARKLRSLAEEENRSIDDLLTAMIEHYTAAERTSPVHDLPPRPASSLTDADIELPDWIRDKDKDQFRQAEREIRPTLYRIARHYWQEVGDTQRLALTDEELDKQFWLIDNDGIPRLKSERDAVTLLPNPLLEMAKRAYLESEPGTLATRDISSRSREILNEEFPRYLKERMDRNAE